MVFTVTLKSIFQPCMELPTRAAVYLAHIVFLTTEHSTLQYHNQWYVSSCVKTLNQVLPIVTTFLQSSLNQLQSHCTFNNHGLERWWGGGRQPGKIRGQTGDQAKVICN